MRLHCLQIKGFRQFFDTTIHFSDATFLIGKNNSGKSSILKAIEYLLKRETLDEQDCLQYPDANGNQAYDKKEVELIAEFRDVPLEAGTWRGFKGRVFNYTPENEGETGLKITYRKVLKYGDKKAAFFLRTYKRIRKTEFANLTKPNDFIAAGLLPEIFNEIAEEADFGKALKVDKLELIDEIWDIDTTQEEWFSNPGGIHGNIACRLPDFLLIPAQDKADEISGGSGTLVQILKQLFNEVRGQSDNYRKAQEHLALLEAEFNPRDETKELGRMMQGLNRILAGVFPSSKVSADASLKDSDTVLQPTFVVSMASNITTSVAYQGTGSVRAAVFALLRYKAQRDNTLRLAADNIRKSLIIAFEEPEIYLHPQVAYQMREVIYELALEPHNQIICSTHSPYMIDLSRGKLKQVLNLCTPIRITTEQYDIESTDIIPFNTTDSFRALIDDDKDYVKMLLKMDDNIAKVFFARKVLIVEGDTEEIVLRETLNLYPDEAIRKEIFTSWQIVRARGKAAIIPLVKYLKAMSINPYVMHDLDIINGATVFNEPIARAVDNVRQLFVLQNCIEDVLGYAPPTNNKPFQAYKLTRTWQSWDDVPNAWRNIVTRIFSDEMRPAILNAA